MRRVDPIESSEDGEVLLKVQAQINHSYTLTPEQAEQLLATHGKTFHFATRFFPPVYRQAVVILYAFFRTLDDLVDERGQLWCAENVRTELENWHEWFQGGFPTPAPREPLGEALAMLLRRYQIPSNLFLDFLAGLLSDLEPRQHRDFHELYLYCYRVAGTVGLAMAHILGGNSEQALSAAQSLGIAMQLTNILRDVGRDMAAERVYLPQDELEQAGFSRHQLRHLYLEQKGPDERFRVLMRDQIKRARYYYAQGLHGIWLLTPECRLPVLLAGRLYQSILLEIERQQYDVLRERASTSLFTKMREAGIVFLLNYLWKRGEVKLAAGREIPYEG